MLTKDAILAAQDLPTEDITVLEWGGDVRVRTMSGAARDAFGASLRGAAGKVDLVNYRAKLLVHTLIDDAGAPMFTVTDVEALNAKSSAALDRVFKVAERLNGLQPDAVETAEKN